MKKKIKNHHYLKLFLSLIKNSHYYILYVFIGEQILKILIKIIGLNFANV